MSSTIDVKVPEDRINEALIELGYPMMTVEKLPSGLNSYENIKNVFFKKALEKYFEFFPVKTEQSVNLSGSSDFEIDFPDPEYTFGVLDARTGDRFQVSTAGGIVGNPFIDLRQIRSMNSSGIGKYGTPYSYGSESTYGYEKAERQASYNIDRAFRITVDYDNRKLRGYAFNGGLMSITWANYSYDFNDVLFDKRDDVVKLASSFILRSFANITQLQNTDTVNNLDGGWMEARAEELKQEVMTKFQNHTKVVLLRGN